MLGIGPLRSTDRPYERRRRGPVIALVAVLATIAVITWTSVLVNAAGPSRGRECPPPASGSVPGQALAPDTLDATTPLPASAVKIRVLNAGGQRGQANLVAAQLGDLGFGEAAAPTNDPYYPDGDMDCTGQIRFGPAGESGASTVALVLPCAQLIRDDRTDDAIDVAVGTEFGDVKPGTAVRDALDQLAGESSGSGGSTDTTNAPAQAHSVDPEVLAQAREASAC